MTVPHRRSPPDVTDPLTLSLDGLHREDVRRLRTLHTQAAASAELLAEYGRHRRGGLSKPAALSRIAERLTAAEGREVTEDAVSWRIWRRKRRGPGQARR